MKYAIDAEVMNALMAYLSRRPYEEVAPFTMYFTDVMMNGKQLNGETHGKIESIETTSRRTNSNESE
jgi:hypothetical protein